MRSHDVVTFFSMSLVETGYQEVNLYVRTEDKAKGSETPGHCVPFGKSRIPLDGPACISCVMPFPYAGLSISSVALEHVLGPP